jgi:4'-phosphopantetheinyl transferase EntD
MSYYQRIGLRSQRKVHWRFEDDSLREFADTMPDIAKTSVVIATVTDHCDQLFAEERDELEPMAQVRQFGFSSGRHAAHLAQSALGLDPAAIGRQQRVPIWPNTCIGSITHTDRFAGAAASTELTALGLDMEEAGRVDEKLHRMLFTEKEAKMLNALPQGAPTVAFSAKESGYKAIYPIGQQFIGFKEAEIDLDWARQRFTIDYVGDHAPNKALNSGQGFWQVHADHVLTVFIID